MSVYSARIKETLYRLRFYRLNRLQDRPYILNYHMVSNAPNGFYPETSTKVFKKHIIHLCRNYRIISLDEMISRIMDQRSLRGCIAITFDDGFKDNYENAYPILKAFSIPATIFVTSGYVDSGETPWFIKVRHAFMQTAKTQVDLSIINRPGSYTMRTRREKFQTSELVMGYVKTRSPEERMSLLAELFNDLGIHESDHPEGLMLNWRQIRQMSENGIIMGAHTVTHPILSTMPPRDVDWEIRTSRQAIEHRIDRPVTSFAYPFGKRQHYNSECISVLRRAGFICAVTTERGADIRKEDPFELSRSGPWELPLVHT